MPTILQINVTANWGSTGKIAESIGSLAQSKGWNSYIAYGRYMNPSKNNLIKIGSQFDVYEHYAENMLLGNEGLASRNATKALIERIEAVCPDVVHLHNIHDHYLNYQILFEFLNKKDIPVVWTFHDCWAFAGSCYYFDDTNCEQWKTRCDKCPAPEGFIDRARHHYELKKSLYGNKENLVIVPVSDWIANLTKESFLKNRRIVTIKNGIDLNVFKPAHTNLRSQLSIPKDKTIVLGVALPWSARKGLKDFVRLSENESLQIVLVGVSPKQKKELPRNIIAVEKTSSASELAEYYSMADVFVNATYSDNYPTTNLEAMACGTPVITYRTGGSPEAVDEKTGIVVDQGNVTALANAIIYLREHPLSSEDCRKRAEEHFDKDKCFEKYIELYNSLLSDK